MSIERYTRWNHLIPATEAGAARRNMEDAAFTLALQHAESTGKYFTLEAGTLLLGERIGNIQKQHHRHILLLIGIFGVGKTFLSQALHTGAELAGLKSQRWHDDHRAIDLFTQLKDGKDPTNDHALAIVGHWNGARCITYSPIITRNEYTVVSLIADQQTRINNAIADGRPGFIRECDHEERRETSRRSIYEYSNFIDADADMVVDVSEECRITAEQISELFCKGIWTGMKS